MSTGEDLSASHRKVLDNFLAQRKDDAHFVGWIDDGDKKKDKYIAIVGNSRFYLIDSKGKVGSGGVCSCQCSLCCEHCCFPSPVRVVFCCLLLLALDE